jgi:SAM-dependent methyltransferase
MTQGSIDLANAAFWNEMCGTTAAQNLGVLGNDQASLAKFDAWYFGFYPYLADEIDFESIAGKDVLEVGLGYGSVSQRLAEMGARYTGLDIAAGPVAGVNHRLKQAKLPGKAIQGSILQSDLADASFDVVVAIGCYHHTGNLERALDETCRLLRKGGRATIMIYNATGYTSWIRAPRRTFKYMRDVAMADPAPCSLITDKSRGDFDRNSSGVAAPETVMLSKPHFERILSRRFSKVSIRRRNAIAHRPFQFIPRSVVSSTVGPILGLDLYAQVVRG